MKVLVIGVAGKLGRKVAEQLLADGHQLLGIDRRPVETEIQGLQMNMTDLLGRAAEDVFRTQRPDAVIHMATVTYLGAKNDDRHRVNLGGTKSVFDYCHLYGVKHAVFVGRHTYYGAAPDSPLYHTEDEPPLGIETFPELADLVAADLYAGSALWRYPEVNTAVLRLCYTLGPMQHGTLAAFLRGPRVPTVLGFDPLFHFMHEEDAARAIVTALECRLRGVYNVAGPRPLPLAAVIRETGRKNLPLPERIYPLLMGHFGLPRLPSGATSHVKYSVVIDDSAFRKATSYQHRFDEYETLRTFRVASVDA